MPYVNIPPSRLVASIARLVGKIEGDITGKVLAKAGTLESLFKSEGCPTNLNRIRNQKNGLDNALASIDGRISKFRRLPKKLKGPVNGLKKALKIILSLPIPQAVPPGIGLPINITTKFADLLHLIKEFIRQISDDIDGLEVILSGPAGSLKSIQRLMNNVEFALKTCEIERAIQLQLQKNAISIKELEDLGIAEEGELIISNLGPKLLGSGLTLDNRSVKEMAKETGLSEDEVYEQLITSNSTGEQSQSGTISSNTSDTSSAVKTLTDTIQKLQNSNLPIEVKNEIKSLGDLFTEVPADSRGENTKYKHYGPNGTLYNLEILKDPDSPDIAPLRFAIAKDPSNVVVLKGAKSFASTVDVLLNEIKFRIDNQLP